MIPGAISQNQVYCIVSPRHANLYTCHKKHGGRYGTARQILPDLIRKQRIGNHYNFSNGSHFHLPYQKWIVVTFNNKKSLEMKKLDNQELHKLMGGGIDPGKGDFENSIYTLAGATRFGDGKEKEEDDTEPNEDDVSE